MVQEAKRLRRKTKAGQRSLREIAAELAKMEFEFKDKDGNTRRRRGVNERGAVFSPSAIASTLAA
jgi:hypothetical protein